MALFVGKLDPTIPVDEVKELFKKHGALKRFDHRETYCFVSYEDMASADEAIRTLQDALVGTSKINIEWTRESGRYLENRPRDDGSQPRVRAADRRDRSRAAARAPPPAARSEYRTHTLDVESGASSSSGHRRRGSRSGSPLRRGGSREGQARAESPVRLDSRRRGSPKRITLRSVRRDRDGDKDRDRERDRSDSRGRDRDRDREREREKDRGEWRRRDSSVERDVRDGRRDRESRDGRDGRDGARNGGDRRDGSRERERDRGRDRDDRVGYRDDRDRDRFYERDRGSDRDRPSRNSVRRDSYDGGRVRSRSPVKGRVNGHNGRSRSRSPRPLTPNRSPTPPRSMRRSRTRSRSRSLSPVNGRNGTTSKLRRSPSPAARRRSRS